MKTKNYNRYKEDKVLLKARLTYFFSLILVSSLSSCIPSNAVIDDPQVLLWRSSWSIDEAQSQALGLATKAVTDGLLRPVNISHVGDGSGRLFVLEQAGQIRIIEKGELLAEPFLDLSDKVGCCGIEIGLLGFAAHPNYHENGIFFVSYTAPEGDNIIAKYQVATNPYRADPDSSEIILRIPQDGDQHNGGHITFGPDNYLYIGIGDGNFRDNPQKEKHAQNTNLLWGKILRIDVDSAFPYTVPSDNPFINVPNAKEEIWAYGFRNPWRFSFDRNLLYVADVGQSRWEELNINSTSETKGANFGWPYTEALNCFKTEECDTSNFILPKFQYDHKEGCSIIGGYVYRGEQVPQLRGIYLYGDFCQGKIWAVASHEGIWRTTLLFDEQYNITTFGIDEEGEIYFTDYGLGVIYKIVNVTEPSFN